MEWRGPSAQENGRRHREMGIPRPKPGISRGRELFPRLRPLIEKFDDSRPLRRESPAWDDGYEPRSADQQETVTTPALPAH